MLSVLHKEQEYKVEKLKYKKVGGHAAEDQNQIPNSSWQAFDFRQEVLRVFVRAISFFFPIVSKYAFYTG